MPLPVQDLSDIFGPNGPEPGEGYDPSTGVTRLTVHPIQVADKSTVDVDALAAKYSAGSSNLAETKSNVDVDTLAAKYGKLTGTTLPKDYSESSGILRNLVTGAGQGIKDAGLSVGQYLLKTDNPDVDTKVNEAIKAQNDKFTQEHGDSTAASIGRIGGELAATAPMLPTKALEGINLASKALPPILNKLGTIVGKGALAGGVFGATTNSTNDQGLPTNIAVNALGGAIGSPVVAGTGALLSKIIPAGKALWAKFGPIQQLANTSGAPASAIRNTIQVLENAGFTPETAQAALTKMGPQATLADLDPSLTTELSGIASLGGKSTAIAKGRMQARADTADSQAKGIITKELGPKPDIEAEKQKIYNEAVKSVRPYYDTAYKSGDKIDISDLIKDIDKKLENAVGAKASILKVAKSYLFKTIKDEEGNPVQTLKTEIPALHEVRMALDDVISKAKAPTTSQGKNTLKAVEDVRSGVDEALKANPQMKAADEKFAEKMEVKKLLDYDWKKGNKEEFQAKFINSTADEQNAIRKKMAADIHDDMESASRGELAGAQQLFGKKSVNRAKFQTAFGAKADKILDALTNQGAMRGTEKSVAQGSQTAERQSVQRKYGDAPAPGYGHEIAKGLAFDIAGGHGAAAVYMAGKKYVGSKIINYSENKLGALREGTADLLSRQGLPRDNALSSMSKVKSIQNSVLESKSRKVRLPVIASPIVGQGGYEEYNKLVGKR